MFTSTVLRGAALGAVLAAGLATTAMAHRMWVLPSSFTLSGDQQWITVDAAISNDLFFPNHETFPLSDLTVIAPDGGVSGVTEGWEGVHRTTFDLKLDQQGTYRIVGGGGMFFARWTENGEAMNTRGMLDELRERGILDKDGVALMHSGRRVETFVTLGAPSDTALAVTGQGLEMEMLTHPNDIYVGEEASFRVLLDGEPAAGQPIEIIADHDRYRDGVDAITRISGEDGRFTVAFDTPGRYWMNTGVEGATTTIEGMEMEAIANYVAVLEVLPH